MNTHLEKAIYIAGELDAVLSAIDELHMENAESRHQNLYTVALDMVKVLCDELDLLADDRRVVDAIYAANDVRRQRTLTTED